MAANAPVIRPEDSSLQLKVRVELRINAKTEAFAKTLKIAAHRGVVTLEGIVPSEIDSLNAQRIALGIPGVASVANKLQVGR